uniref:Uncharacterized protein n=1 Tax=viral metagenome TaxID=1070528 RepID=A0A6C0AE75_9ZZZZ
MKEINSAYDFLINGDYNALEEFERAQKEEKKFQEADEKLKKEKEKESIFNKYNEDFENLKKFMEKKKYKTTPEIVMAFKIYLLDAYNSNNFSSTEYYYISIEQLKIISIIWLKCSEEKESKKYYEKYINEKLKTYKQEKNFIKIIIPYLLENLKEKFPTEILQKIEKEETEIPDKWIYYRNYGYNRPYKTNDSKKIIDMIKEYNILSSGTIKIKYKYSFN